MHESPLVVTNEHVVRGLDTFEVHFPQEQDGKALVDPDEYLEHRAPIKATAIDRDKTRDEEALQDFAHAIELKPDHALYYEHTGDTLYYLGRYEEAVKAYNKAIDIDPDVASAYRGRGDAYEALKNTKAAARDFQRAKELEKK